MTLRYDRPYPWDVDPYEIQYDWLMEISEGQDEELLSELLANTALLVGKLQGLENKLDAHLESRKV